MSRRAFGPLISTQQLAERGDDAGLVVVEVDERPLVYARGHIPGARNVHWREELQDPIVRDIPEPAALAALWQRLGITRDVDVVLYGDQHNWYAAMAYWLFAMHGLRRLAILDGGRQAWLAEGRPLTDEEPPPAGASALRPRRDPSLRAQATDIVATTRAGGTVVDVRTRAEYSGEIRAEPGYTDEGAQRPGHIPGAIHLPWELAIDEDGRFRDAAALRALVAEHGIREDGPIVTYCRIGERSAHTWFVLHELLGLERVRNYDGSWAEWGSMVGLPVARGDLPGVLPDHVARLEAA